MKEEFPIVGIQKLSVIDYPGKLCATLFTPSCNFRCPYCYNVDLIINPDKMTRIPEQNIVDFLHHRIGFLDGVCITGGEPTLHQGLPDFLYKIKSIGSLVKLDTNGSQPDMIRILLDCDLLDYVAMDIKAPLDKYPETVNYNINPATIEETINMLRQSNIDHEFRTTVVPGLTPFEDIVEIARTLAGSKLYVLQQFKPGKTLCPEYKDIQPYSEAEMKRLRGLVEPYFVDVKLRS